MKILVLLALLIAKTNCKEFHIEGIPSDRPLNIGHRGSSGFNLNTLYKQGKHLLHTFHKINRLKFNLSLRDFVKNIGKS